MSTDDAFPESGLTARTFKRRCVVQLFVNDVTDVFACDVGDGLHAMLGVNNVEFVGSWQRLEKLAAALAELVERRRLDPDVFDRWRRDGRVGGHPLQRTLLAATPEVSAAGED